MAAAEIYTKTNAENIVKTTIHLANVSLSNVLVVWLLLQGSGKKTQYVKNNKPKYSLSTG